MLTITDLKKLKGIFATKDELQSVRSELKGDILTFKDEILYEVKAMCDEIHVIIGYRDQIEDHEVRRTKLEEKTLPKS